MGERAQPQTIARAYTAGSVIGRCASKIPSGDWCWRMWMAFATSSASRETAGVLPTVFCPTSERKCLAGYFDWNNAICWIMACRSADQGGIHMGQETYKYLILFSNKMFFISKKQIAKHIVTHMNSNQGFHRRALSESCSNHTEGAHVACIAGLPWAKHLHSYLGLIFCLSFCERSCQRLRQ